MNAGRLRIDSLTGLRFFAAIWVVLFHIRGNLQQEYPVAYRVVEPVIAYGEYGVDLFFALSGFVLALAYSERLGQRWSWKATGKFYWARFARIWPAYFFMLLFTAFWHLSFVWRDIADPVAPRDLSWGSFLRQALMIVLWTEPNSDRLTWNGAAWTVSAEMLAYLVFPAFALIVHRHVCQARARTLAAWTLLLILPLGIVAMRSGLYAPWMWVLRIACSFGAGYMAFFLMLRIRGRTWAKRWSGAFVGISLVGAFLWLSFCLGLGEHDRGNIVIVLFPFLLTALSIDREWIARLMELPAAQLGGKISYSIYLVHMPIIEILWYLQTYHKSTCSPDQPAAKIGFLLIPIVVTLAGYLLWRFIEEPARRMLKKVIS
ncbi:acyltransferase family protein [Pseudoclavibacter caeni]|jgi:peptidoglycan/LPS O-acetylase OafA/YrhL|uniref:Acyltransferase n=1 Tax=Pseudoclavibacter caeni TaxID=908846 RepID=A0A7C8BP91_9MICO|nr:acyltransferase [Pseudoclavibacter caeni]KAB1633630.1 acyltransferase [Pseudoclavibacter caeni]NYJ96355.1 peptidoglycan/LPS O-acetylase OafA/YrhL [Pseudoclavibacter caeni]